MSSSLLTWSAPTVSARAASDSLQQGRYLVSPTFAPISTNIMGDNTIVAAVAGLQIRVVSYYIVVGADVVLTWKSSIAGAISGPLAFAANGGIATPYCPVGIMQTATGEGLVLNLSLAISIGGSLTYVAVVPA